MRISIVTVCLNAARTLPDAIESVLGQDYPNIEYIVKDGGSTDGTTELLGRYPRGKLKVACSVDAGIYDAMNAGLAMATGDIVGFLNADDMFADKSVLSRVANVLLSTGASLVYGDIDIVDQHDTSRVLRTWRTGHYRQGAFQRGWHPPHPAFYARRENLLTAGAFDARYRISADFILMMKLMQVMELQSVYEPSVFVRMRAGGASSGTIQGIIRGNWECREGMKALGIRPPLTFPWNKLLSKIMQLA